MARVPEVEIERLKEQVSLVSLVRAHGVELRKAGADLVGRCPFHDDRSPSLVVTPVKNLWHCLGACQTGGSVVDWVMRAEGVSFRHAVELLRDGMPTLSTAGSSAPKRSTVRKPPTPVQQGAASADNALAESFNATLKRELLQSAAAWPDALSCRREVFRWATRYNTRRRHSWCGQQPPNTYETLHAGTVQQAA